MNCQMKYGVSLVRSLEENLKNKIGPLGWLWSKSEFLNHAITQAVGIWADQMYGDTNCCVSNKLQKETQCNTIFRIHCQKLKFSSILDAGAETVAVKVR